MFPLLVVDLGFSRSNLIVQQQLPADVGRRVIGAVGLNHLVSLLFSRETECEVCQCGIRWTASSHQVWQVALSLPLLTEIHHGVYRSARTVRIEFLYPGQTSSSPTPRVQVTAGAEAEAPAELGGGFLPPGRGCGLGRDPTETSEEDSVAVRVGLWRWRELLAGRLPGPLPD